MRCGFRPGDSSRRRIESVISTAAIPATPLFAMSCGRRRLVLVTWSRALGEMGLRRQTLGLCPFRPTGVHMHQALARKWRPSRFDELVGQPAVVQALSNAFAQQRLHHAYLLTGTRGVGKTTLGRILARCFNCETGPTATPCGTCQSCVEIAAGRHVDLIEVDAASRTKVEDTRELLENAQYAPVSGRFKIYLIDEVHMLSEKSFNALLKTLEEPPEHVKFILATTDPQKLPITVISRCLQFALAPMAPAVIQSRLAEILAAESVSAESAALARIAEAAQGSMRDALSLTEQAIAFGGGRIDEAQVSEMLGFLPRDRITALLDAVFAGDAWTLLERLADLRRHGPDWARLLADAADLCYLLALAQAARIAGGGAAEDTTQTRKGWAGSSAALSALLPIRAEAVRDWLATRAATVDGAILQLCFQILIEGGRDLAFAPSEATGAEMTFLRALAFWPQSPIPSHQSDQPPSHGSSHPSSDPTSKPERTTVKASALQRADAAACPEGTSTEMVADSASRSAGNSADHRPGSSLNDPAGHSATRTAPHSLSGASAVMAEAQPSRRAPPDAVPLDRASDSTGKVPRSEAVSLTGSANPSSSQRETLAPTTSAPVRSDALREPVQASPRGLGAMSSEAESNRIGELHAETSAAAAPTFDAIETLQDRSATERGAGPKSSADKAAEIAARGNGVSAGVVSEVGVSGSRSRQNDTRTETMVVDPHDQQRGAATTSEVQSREETTDPADSVDIFDDDAFARLWPTWADSLSSGFLRQIAMNSTARWRRRDKELVLELSFAPVAEAIASAERLARLHDALSPTVALVCEGRPWRIVAAGHFSDADATPQAQSEARERRRRERIEKHVRLSPIVRSLVENQGFVMESLEVAEASIATDRAGRDHQVGHDLDARASRERSA